MIIHPNTLCFDELTDDESAEIAEVADNILYTGKIPNPRPEWLDAWLAAAGAGESQTLLYLSTIFPARAYRSVLCHVGGSSADWKPE